jgi:hypothetical protein
MSIFKRLFSTNKEAKQSTLLAQAQKLAGPIIIMSFRNFASSRGIAPSSKTSDEKIIEIYQKVGTAFRQVATQRNEIISAGVLNNIVLKFFQVYEGYGEEMFDSHLKYELSKFLNEGLRPDYKIELNLF